MGKRESLVGQRFGKQVVLRELEGDYVEIRCDCGTVKKSRKQYIKNGQSKSCGCGRYDARPDTPPISVGDRFHRFEVVQLLGTDGHKRQVLARCDCGTLKVIAEGELRSGATKACGCLRRERATFLNRTHGQGGKTRTVLYRTWEAARRRVKGQGRYASYAEKGMHPEWDSFEVFRDYIEKNLGERPVGMSLDRINNNEGYFPGNLRWASPRTQVRNRSSNVHVEINGVSRCLAEWADILGIPSSVVYMRLKNGWTAHDALLIPVEPRKKKT